MKKKDLNGKVVVKQFKNESMIIKYENEVEFKKIERALKKYCGKSYKYYCYKVLPKLKQEQKIDGSYEIDLMGDKAFNKVYGDLKLLFRVENDVATLEKIIPEDILYAGYVKQLNTYKGVPYRDNKDLLKLKVLGD